MKMIWILVANQSEARIYSCERVTGNLMLIDKLVNEEGSSHPRDLTSDAPGRAFDSFGPGRHSMEPSTGVKEEHRRRFVKEMVERLQAGLVKSGFDKLVLLAAPAVLGVIRKTLTADLANTVIKEIPKDVIGQDVDKISQQLTRAFALR
jgi:protein required for attachment to host cells